MNIYNEYSYSIYNYNSSHLVVGFLHVKGNYYEIYYEIMYKPTWFHDSN